MAETCGDGDSITDGQDLCIDLSILNLAYKM